MTLDDETAASIARGVVGGGKAARVYPHSTDVALVRAGYAARDAEVEELRAEVQRAKEATREAHWRWEQASEAAEAFNSTLAKVREWAELCFRNPRDGVDGRTDWEYLLSAILDESPTERETPADEWEYAVRDYRAPGYILIGDDPLPAHDRHRLYGTRPLLRRRPAGPWEVVPDDRA